MDLLSQNDDYSMKTWKEILVLSVRSKFLSISMKNKKNSGRKSHSAAHGETIMFDLEKSFWATHKLTDALRQSTIASKRS